MILRDEKGRENIVARFVHDLFAWAGDLIVRLLVAACILLLLILVVAWLNSSLSAEGQTTTHAQSAVTTGETSCSPYRIF